MHDLTISRKTGKRIAPELSFLLLAFLLAHPGEAEVKLPKTEDSDSLKL